MANLSPESVLETIATYKKYGWMLRRLLLSELSRNALRNKLGEDVLVHDAEIDAAWFSRPPGTGPVAWELRYLGEMQYALVEHIDESAPDFENSLRDVELRLASAVAHRGDA
jgi:hypothetical protein